MQIIAGLALGTFFLWVWASGHWFGCLLALLIGETIAILAAVSTGDLAKAFGVLLVAGPMAFGVAVGPFYFWRSRRAVAKDVLFIPYPGE